ncbi:cytochrome P450 [Streptomyces sp. NRRL S-340]|uniref:cytochrome P450 n=1 Tax=Streptomyces sp. NRRL S-340 TaxID=1463901 RepID=UPI000564356B|nr:cytochrome P450 [Streptomyces sp. NRRL S-340]
MTRPITFPQDRSCPYEPPAGYRSLRQEGPLTRVTLYDGSTAWAVTGHAEARRLLGDPRLSADRRKPGFPMTSHVLTALRHLPPLLFNADEPEHGRQRRMLIPGFGVPRIRALRPRIQQIVDELLDTMVEQGPPAELVSAFALPVPSMAISLLLGVPYEDHTSFEELSRLVMRGSGPEESAAARGKMLGYLEGLLIDKERRRRQGQEDGPQSGLLDELVRDRLLTGQTDHEEIARLAFNLLVAGHETTTNMISLGTLLLLERPDRTAALRADPGLLPQTVDELMRHLSVVDELLRVATEDIPCGTQVIRAGEGVVFNTSMINRDADHFPEPDELRLDRAGQHHLAFGFGVHQCLGQNLARLELEVALGTLFRRLPRLRSSVTVDELPIKPGDTIQGLIEFPVEW